MSAVHDTDEASALSYRLIQFGIMLASIFASGLSIGDQSKLAASIGWTELHGWQSYFLPWSVILLEAIALIVWMHAPDASTRTKAFWWAAVASCVSYSLNLTWNRISNGYAEQTEALIWYLSGVPNLMMVASLKVGSLIHAPRRRKEDNGREEVSEEAAEVEEEADQRPKPESELPAQPVEAPPVEAGEEDMEDDDRRPIIRPVPSGKGTPREAVILCLAEIQRRVDSGQDPDDGLTGSYLADTYGRISIRAWNMAKREARELWDADEAACRTLLNERVSA